MYVVTIPRSLGGLFVLSIVLVAGLFATPAMAQGSAANHIVAEQQKLPDYLQLQGVVEARNAATVSAQVSGRVQQVLVDVGDNVSAGSTIVTLTSVEQYQALAQAESELAAANANLLATQQEHDRVTKMVAQNLLSTAERDRVQANLETAKAQKTSAQAAVARAQEQLSYTEVKAPYAGLVSERLVEPGELVQPGTPLMSGFDPEQLRIHVDLPATYASAAANFAWARVAGVTPLEFLVFPTAHQRSGTQRLRLTLPSQTGFLPGQWQSVKVKVGEHQGVVIPAAALYRQGELTMVKLASGNWRAVRVGARYGSDIEIIAGLAAGEAVQYGN
ncbi:Multidrug resistance protein MdtA [Pseudidiomarina piscicola]|uniref:Multidrug resistance protein MdtA n=1 Tax=Pseudidiomarina piscicola TaxID=2614830 RepID=A0A6S6WKT7_9GAMM|nr:efflux RND transporter periplasmic adaptor subunit [Pseudidiomarina piscicola]CAB0151407.1 Multidrug resistance protein MdtA [Pseudidiomarina piscicola]VZT40887.1 Multidrug resistance protein MdtA [Pseudomonas aeruginosa]